MLFVYQWLRNSHPRFYFFGDNLFLFKLTLEETKFFTEQILPEYPCSTSENLKLSPQNSVSILEKFALVETMHIFRINTEGAVHGS